MKHAFQSLHLLLWTLLVLTIGYAFGRFVFVLEEVSAPAPIVVLQEDIHTPVPVVHIQEINNGVLHGTIDEGSRLVLGDDIVVPYPDGTFRVPANAFLVNIIDMHIPEDMRFVASSRGSKYYPVASSAAERLSPANRIYFRSAEEAESRGYTKAQ